MSKVDQLVTAKFILDSTGFNDSIKGINSELRNAQSSFRDASTQVGVFGKDSEKLQAVQESLAKQVELHAKKVDLYKESMEKTTTKMNENIKERDKLKDSLDKANKSYDEAVKLYGKESEEAKKAKEEVDKLSKEYKNKEVAIESNAKAIQNYETNMNKANTQMTIAQGELNKVNKELEDSKSKWLSASESLKEHGEKLKDVGSKMTGVGNNILKMTAPLVGIGVASLKVSSDFQSGMSEVQAISGATGKDLEKLTEKAKYMGETTKFSASEASEGLKYMAMAGWDTTQMLDGLEGVMMLAAASGESLGSVSDIVTDALTAFGLAAEDAGHFADVLATASSSSNTNVGMMGETFKYAAPLAGALGFTIEDTALAIGLMANAGIKGSQAGTALRAIFSEMTGPMDIVGKSFGHLSIMTENTDGSMRDLNDIISDTRELWPYLTEAEQAHNAETMVGKQAMSGWLAIMNSSEKDFMNLKNNIDNSTGSAKEMADVMNDNLSGEIVLLKSQLEGLAIQIGEVLIPYAGKFVGWLSTMADKLSQVSPETIETTAKIVGMTVALGGILSIGGKLISGIGSISIGMSAIAGLMGTTTVATVGLGGAAAVGATGVGALAAGLGAAVVAAAPFIAVGAVVAGVGYLIHKELSEQAIPALDLFADEITLTADTVEESYGRMGDAVAVTTFKISEGTKESVGAFLELEKQAVLSLNQMAWSGEKVSEEMMLSVTSNTDAMADAVIDKLREQKEEGLKHLEEMFKNSVKLSETEKKDMIRIATEKFDKEIEEAERGKKKIAEILTKAKEENRKITDEERKEIIKITESLKKESIKLMTENQQEQEIILKRLRDNAGTITAEMAAEVVKNSLEQKTKRIAEAKEEYEKVLAFAADLKRDGTKESRELADAIIKDAEAKYDTSIFFAEKMHSEVVEEAKQQAEEHVGHIDWETGELMSKWEVATNAVKGFIGGLIDKVKEWNSTKMEDKEVTMTTNNVTNEITNKIEGPGPSAPSISKNWRGNDNFEGGLTTLHEKGYEVYDLPRGTRIYNNEASEDMVRKTAEAVAKRIVMQNSGAKDVNVTQHIYVPTPRPSEIARQTKKQLQTMAFDL